MYGRDYKNIWVGVNFLSIMGYETAKVPLMDDVLMGLKEKAAYTIIGRVSVSNPEVVAELAQSNEVIE
jgi:hypothetical protein